MQSLPHFNWRRLAIPALLFTVLALILAACTLPTTPQTVWFVAPTGNDSNACRTPETACRTINAAIDKAADGDTIRIAAGTYRERTTRRNNAGILIDKNLDLIGEGIDHTILDGDGTVGVVVINGAITGISAMTIRNGGGPYGEGVFASLGSFLVLRDAMVRDNAGSGILAIDGFLDVENTTVSDNRGSGIVINGNTTIRGSRITGNQVVGVENQGQLRIFDSTIHGNHRGLVNWVGGRAIIQRSTISGGQDSRSTAVDNEGRMTLVDSTVSDNLGRGIRNNFGGIATIRGSRITGNQNGGVENQGELTMLDSTIHGNNLIYEEIGRVDRGSGLLNNGLAIIERSTFSGNQGNNAAYSYAVYHAGGRMTLVDSTISDNRGGGISNNFGGIATIRGSRIIGNQNGGVLNFGELTILDSTIHGNHHERRGSGIMNFSYGRVLIERSTISGNQSDDVASGAVLNGGRMTLVNSTVSGNQYAGIINVGVRESVGNHLSLSYVTVSGNGAPGVVVEGWGIPISITNSLISNNADQDCYFSPAFSQFELFWEQRRLDPWNNFSDGSCNLSYLYYERPPGGDMFLGNLADNGGPTQTHALLPGHDGIDSATGFCPATDQRGVGRPAGGGCDLGAYEYMPALMASTPAPTETLPAVPALIFTATPTPTQGVPMVRFIKNAFCRKGPGTVYDVVTALEQGNEARAEGRNKQNTWWWILLPNSTAHCWVSDVTVEKSGPFDQLPIIQEPPTPTPSPAPKPVPGCYVYDQQKNPVCTAPCPPNALPGGACTP